MAGYRLQTALRDQETATRGYAIAADRQFLEPYYEGQARRTAPPSTACMQRLAGRPELLADLDAVEQAATNWRATYAEPLIASVKPGDVDVIDPATIDRGKAEFDDIRSAFRHPKRST